MPESARLYAGPYEWYEKYGIRRYGFHGINHSYCSKRAAEILRKPVTELRMITCHLGGGASLAAINCGKSVMTTMGYTPLEGLMMCTRSGSVDPGVLMHLLAHKKYSPEKLLEELNRNSGLKGISGSSDNMKDVLHNLSIGDSRSKLAFDMYIHSLQMYIGAMLGPLAGLDAIVFTGGIGENSAAVRAAACAPFRFIGISIDDAINKSCTSDQNISSPDSTVDTLVVHAQEEAAIAKECLMLLCNS